MEDTICAIATSLGVGSISIIKISGPQAIKIVSGLFDGKTFKNCKSHHVYYGHIIDNKEIIDEVLINVMKKPKTYTTEDVVEINCHGGIIVTNKILNLLLKSGCRLASPGEFTKRAFLNGRIDLVEAEAVSDMIKAQTDIARSQAIKQIEGTTSNTINSLKKITLKIIANIEVNIDYPEYEDIEIITHKKILPELLKAKQIVENLLSNSQNSHLINEGINIVLLGKPNAGKSSILNKLIQEDKAIVTEIAGTTRDIVEGKFMLNNILINIFDTAGIRKTKDKIEELGVKKSLELVNHADLLILVLDNNEELLPDNLEMIHNISKEKIIFVNKNDLDSKIDREKIKDYNTVYGNALTIDGLNSLKEEIIKLFNLEKIDTKDINYISNERQLDLLNKSLSSIKKAIKETKNNIPLDLISVTMNDFINCLNEILGETYQEEVLDEIFSNFCVGK